MKTIYDRVRVFRLAKGLSQENVAELLGTTQPSYARMESGKTRIPINYVNKMAEIFGIHPYQIIQEITDNNSNMLNESFIHTKQNQKTQREVDLEARIDDLQKTVNDLRTTVEDLRIEKERLLLKLVGDNSKSI